MIQRSSSATVFMCEKFPLEAGMKSQIEQILE